MPELVEYLDSFGNLYCVGRNGQHRYNNMDHSMATAIEAVGNIKNGKTSKKNVCPSIPTRAITRKSRFR